MLREAACKLGNKDVAAKHMLTALVLFLNAGKTSSLSDVKNKRTECLEGIVSGWMDGSLLLFWGCNLK